MTALACTAALAGGPARADPGVSPTTGFTTFTTRTRFGSATAQNDTPGSGAPILAGLGWLAVPARRRAWR